MEKALEKGFPTATDLADWLVANISIPFRESHQISGQVVKLAEKLNCKLDELSLDHLQSVDNRINKDAIKFLNVKHSLNSKISYGGTSPSEVKKQIKLAKKRFL